MRDTQPPTHPPTHPRTGGPQPVSPIVRRIEAGHPVSDLMRRGEIGGQALGLIQLVAAQRRGEAGLPGTGQRVPASAGCN